MEKVCHGLPKKMTFGVTFSTARSLDSTDSFVDRLFRMTHTSYSTENLHPNVKSSADFHWVARLLKMVLKPLLQVGEHQM